MKGNCDLHHYLVYGAVFRVISATLRSYAVSMPPALSNPEALKCRGYAE